jgi:hypothetical protein
VLEKRRASQVGRDAERRSAGTPDLGKPGQAEGNDARVHVRGSVVVRVPRDSFSCTCSCTCSFS